MGREIKKTLEKNLYDTLLAVCDAKFLSCLHRKDSDCGMCEHCQYSAKVAVKIISVLEEYVEKYDEPQR